MEKHYQNDLKKFEIECQLAHLKADEAREDRASRIFPSFDDAWRHMEFAREYIS